MPPFLATLPKILLYLAAGTILFGVGFGSARHIIKEMPTPRAGEPRTTNIEHYSLINPTVLADTGKHFIINFTPLRTTIANIAGSYPHKTYFYFVYLNNATWIGFNEKETFTAASLAKVPLAISLYKAVEEGKLALEQTYTVEELDLNNGFGELYKTGRDQSFTLDELIAVMLEQSDNTALSALINVFRKIGIENPYDEVYQAFGWVLDIDKNVNANEINLKTLSNMYLSLYNADYLSLEHSQKMLQHLARSPFNDKIVAGVPPDVVVSHKIGVAGENLTFSDCGIVYAPSRNYLLCLGSEGASEETARRYMKEVSKAVYDFVIHQ